LIKFLNANGLKTRKTIYTEQVVNKQGQKQDNSFAVEYFTGIPKVLFIVCLGADIHFTILSNAKEILKIIKTITSRGNFNNLEKVEDSV
jgi:hypothetical protein